MLVKSVQIINNKKISFLQSEFLDCFYKYILECFARVYQCIDNEGHMSEMNILLLLVIFSEMKSFLRYVILCDNNLTV